MTKMLYVAHPIDQVGTGLTNWGVVMANLVIPAGWFAYRPNRAFQIGRGADPDPRLRTVNDCALGYADAILACLPQGVSTYGTVAELERASRLGKPIALLTDLKPSWSHPEGIKRFALDYAGAAQALDWVTQQGEAR